MLFQDPEVMANTICIRVIFYSWSVSLERQLRTMTTQLQTSFLKHILCVWVNWGRPVLHLPKSSSSNLVTFRRSSYLYRLSSTPVYLVQCGRECPTQQPFPHTSCLPLRGIFHFLAPLLSLLGNLSCTPTAFLVFTSFQNPPLLESPY